METLRNRASAQFPQRIPFHRLPQQLLPCVGWRHAARGPRAQADANLVFELRYGAAERGSRKLTRQVEAVLSAMTIRPLESDIERVHASMRMAVERKGTPIGAHDMMIAAHARALDAVCVTDNVAEFRRVPALKIENWLK
jgi:predicted nucleic acid-binding protein